LFKKRTYVVGTNANGEFRSYGLERIVEFEVTANSFKPKVKNPKGLFAEVIGLYSENERKKVVLSYQAFQGKYI
jgi:hypothetical protein